MKPFKYVHVPLYGKMREAMDEIETQITKAYEPVASSIDITSDIESPMGEICAKTVHIVMWQDKKGEWRGNMHRGEIASTTYKTTWDGRK